MNGQPTGRKTDGFGRAWAPGIVVAVAAVLAVLFYSSTWRTGDDGRYYVFGQALAEGAGLVHFENPLHPPEVISPPLYPAFIAPIIRWMPKPVVWVKRAGSLLYVLAALLAALTLMGSGGQSRAGFLGACMGMFAVGVAAFATYVMSDMLFILLVYLCLWGSRNRPSGALPALLAGACCGAAYLTRAVGLALAAALLFECLVRREWRRMLWIGLGIAVVAGPWLYWKTFVAGVPDPYLAIYEGRAELHYGVNMWTHFPVLAVQELWRDVPRILFRWIPGQFFYAAPKVAFSGAFWRAVHAGVGVLIVGGFLTRFRRWNAVDFFFVFKLLVITLGPGPQTNLYYVFPMLPIAAFYFFCAMAWLARQARERFRLDRAAAGIRVAALLVFFFSLALDFAAGAVHFRRERARRSHPPWAPERYLDFGIDYYDAWARVSEAAGWIQAHTPPDTLVLSRKPQHLLVMSGRQGWRYDAPGDVEAGSTVEAVETFAATRPVVFLEDAFPGQGHPHSYGRTRAGAVDSTIHRHPDRWRLLVQTDEPATRVWGYGDWPELNPLPSVVTDD